MDDSVEIVDFSLEVYIGFVPRGVRMGKVLPPYTIRGFPIQLELLRLSGLRRILASQS